MANSEHVEIVKQGKDAIAKWQELHPGLGLDLSGESFALFDLSRTNLRDANLEGTNFYQTDLTHADLRDVRFGTNSLIKKYTSFKEAKLRHANFSNATGFELVKGLEAKQLGGVNLRGVELPKSVDIKTLESLADVSNHVKYSRTLYLTLIVACVYSWLTIWSASDANIMTNNSGLKLPITSVELPVIAFFLVTPCGILGVYAYFLLYFQKLLERLSLAPAVFPDGKTLDEQADPWIILSFIRLHLTGIEIDKRDKYQYRLIVILVWWIVPITLLGFWHRYMVTQFFWTSFFLISLCVFSIELSIFFYHLAISTMSGKEVEHKKIRWNWLFELLNHRVLQHIRFLFSGVKLFTEFVLNHKWSWITSFLLFVCLLITEYFFVLSFWRPNFEGEKLSAHMLDKYNLSRVNLKRVDFKMASLNQADLSESNLHRALLTEAILENADLRKANLVGANFNKASIRGAKFFEAKLNNATLVGADLTGANLMKSTLINADLREADLSKAVMPLANLENANLRKVKLGHATLNRATLINAVLSEADLSGATLAESDLSGADLCGADLNGAIFVDADLSGADLCGADLLEINLNFAKVNSSEWLDNLLKLDPPVKNFKFNHWIVTERKNGLGNPFYIIVSSGSVEAKKPTLENQQTKQTK